MIKIYTKYFVPSLRGRPAAMAVAMAATLALLAACGGGEKPATEKNDSKQKAEAKSSEHDEKAGLKLSKEEAERAGIQLEALKPQALVDTVKVTATIRPNQDRIARIAPRVEGRVASVLANLGDTVRGGQTVATLDSLSVGEASSALLQAQSTVRVAEADFKRAAALNAEEIIPQREYLRAKSEHEKAEAALRAAEDRLRLLGVSPKQAAGHVQSMFPVTAPFAGTVIEKKATVGALSNPSEPLFVVADLSKVWIEANLAEAMLTKVRVGARAIVTLDAYPGEHFEGRVTYVASVLEKESRTIPARIEVDNPDRRLKPEMFATATIESAATATPKAQVLTVPDAAIVLMQGQPNVFVFEHGGYEQRAIEPGAKLGGRTVIKSGLAAGEQVVSAGTYALKARVLKSQIGDEH
ncbi:efflux RND transporter periplasmic adaptor subunit [Ralstonia sp.]|uniref:efflux RND transporter periplasmic adaptor subunit n=1 Tax=Ralstonia sp. TaxID=54061 RepID=UPI00257CBD56|nr:efflux RND transporter periplasmic adaptor subunit [Ralstonia sp.]MBA4280846.1 efflux RND transporter periplasmic adaptor subunit [Ralstonia sp.]